MAERPAEIVLVRHGETDWERAWGSAEVRPELAEWAYGAYEGSGLGHERETPVIVRWNQDCGEAWG